MQWCVQGPIHHKLFQWLADIYTIPTGGHWEAMKCILRYIKGIIDIDLVFQKDFIGKREGIKYIDANYAGDLDKRQSTTRYVFILS